MTGQACCITIMTNLLLQPLAYSEDWIGLGLDLDQGPSWIVGIQFTEDESKDSSRIVYLSKTLGSQVTLDLQYGTTRLVDQNDSFDSDSFYGQLDWAAGDEVDVALSYRFQGHRNEFEIDQYGLQFSYNPYPASFAVEVLQGELFIHTRDNLPFDFDTSDNVQSDLSATTVSVGWWFENFRLSAMQQRFDYEINISALGSRPLLQLLVKPAALAQSGLLISDQSRISLDIPLSERALALHLLSSRSEVNNSKTKSVQFDWLEALTDSTSLALSINRSDEDQDNWSLSAGLEWNG